ncbi:MAG: porin family protein [Sulfurospirillaceae bacterium]|nr:porin family protein [Sulfurospirillaceae bacterium]MDD3463136.1 porin family protein [Sulfurospirillaceae bacterium]
MKLFILFSILMGYLFASDFDDAQKLFEQKSYIKAYSKFFALLEKEPTNPKYSLHVARCQFALGEYSASEETLKPLVEQGLKDKEILLAYSKSLYAQKKYDKAQAILATLDDSESKALLSSLKDSSKIHHFSGAISFGISYDDNVKNNTHLETTPYAGALLRNDTNKYEDVSHQQMLFFKHTYDMPDFQNIIWQNSALIFNKTLLEYSEENVVFGSLRTGPIYQKGDYTFGVNAVYDRLFYGSEDYLYAYGVGINLQKILTNYLFGYTNVEYKQRKYNQLSDSPKDADRLSIGIGLGHIISPKDFMNYSLTRTQDTKDGGTRIDISKTGWNYEISYARVLTQDMKLQTKFGYESIAYADKDPNLSEREDVRLNLSVGVSKNIDKDLVASINYNFTDNDSNINAYSYQKNNVTLTLSKSF